MKEYIKDVIDEKKICLEKMQSDYYIEKIVQISESVINTLKAGHKLLIAGNGGSAADAQHFAAELVGRFETERRGLPAIALTTDTSILTSVANDYSFGNIFSRQLEAISQEGDAFIGISTSGNSENIIKSVSLARDKGIFTIGLLRKDGGKLCEACDLSLIVPADKTARIQELHEMCIHIICSFVDQAFKEY